MKLNVMKQFFEEKKKKMKVDIGALYFAIKHQDTPLVAKAIAVLVVGYALSPIDLIPDFIPVLGYLDDVILLPLGIGLVIKLIPREIMKECRKNSKTYFNNVKRVSWVAAIMIIIIWLSIIFTIGTKLAN